MTSAAEIVGFWKALGPDGWFTKDDAVDAEVRQRFEALHMAASRRELDGWLESSEGALALLLLLDQFPRNMYRGSAHSYATDGLARWIAEQALAKGFEQEAEPEMRPFFHLPFEHSEDMTDQARCVSLSTRHQEQTGDAEILEYAILHRDIIARFGRFPHRNAALGRETTPEEQAYLDEDGFKG